MLFLELATGLTALQTKEWRDAIAKIRDIAFAPAIEGLEPAEAHEVVKSAVEQLKTEQRRIYCEALSPFVRVCDGPHTVDGQPLATLDDYVKLLQEREDQGTAALVELREALDSFNSISGADELFSLRSSGGARSTDARRTAKAASPKASP